MTSKLAKHVVEKDAVIQVNIAPTTNVFVRKKMFVEQVIVQCVAKVELLIIRNAVQIPWVEILTVMNLIHNWEQNAAKEDKLA